LLHYFLPPEILDFIPNKYTVIAADFQVIFREKSQKAAESFPQGVRLRFLRNFVIMKSKAKNIQGGYYE